MGGGPQGPQYPSDYWGVEGTFDSDGHWQGGKIRDPYQNIPIPRSLDPSQVLPHGSGPTHPGAMPLSEHQVAQLHQGRTLLSEAIGSLQSATTAEDIVYQLPTVLTIANSLVFGTDGWDDHLAEACRTWIATEPTAGTEEQFHHARDAVIAAGWQVFADVDQWLAQNDAIMFSAQGDMALQQLASAATDAHLQLHPAT